MATVFLASFVAHDGAAPVTAAVKRLHPHLAKEHEFRTMLLDEARVSARVVHPNVVRTLDVVEEGDDVVIVMEYALGLPLIAAVRHALEHAGSVDVAVAVGIVVGMLHGLEAAHRATGPDGAPLGIVHRDVSPQNVIVAADGVPRLLDFGIAKARNRMTTTEEGIARGKRGYMAPEQLVGEPLGAATDLFAAAVVLWELVAGERLFDPNDARSGLAARVRDDVTLRPSARRPRNAARSPSGLDGVILRGLRRKPEDRFSSARAMADALVAVVPPAPAAAIASWLDMIAGPELAQMRARVAEVELLANAIVPGSVRGETLMTATRVFSPSRPPPAPLPAAVEASTARTPRRLFTRTYAEVAVAAFLIAMAVAVATKASIQAARTPDTASPDTAAPSLESGEVAGASSPPLTPAAPVAPPTAAVEVVASGVDAVVSAPPAPSVRPVVATAAAAVKHPASAPPSKSKKCSPPYTFDNEGHKLFKPECY